MSIAHPSNRPQLIQTQPHLSRRKLYAAMLIASQWMAAEQVWAAPEGGEIVGGAGVIEQSGVDTMIHQATDRMAIDWRSFDVAANERVEFIQPSSSSIALNRVLGNRGSEILGRIDANGQVMLVNPNGVVFGKNSIVNVGGMIASGMSIDPASFINGDFTLNSLEGTEGKVINYGIINAATGGSVTLVGQQVQNDGLISAKLGAVNLAAGKEAVLTFDQAGMVGVKVTEAVLQNELGLDAAVINSGEIDAEGGRVLLSASVSEDIFSNAVNNAGMNKASSAVVHDDGSFTLGAGADVINTGDIDTSVASGAAGQVVVVGHNITSSGIIAANTGVGTAGAVELHSTDTTLVTEAGSVSARATKQGEGGDIKVLGNKVGLFDTAQIDASGTNGGGQVLIGGDKTGQNKQVRNADFIYLGEHTNVKTDALIDGDGGKLITFASDTARIYGNLYSRGGRESGNGGFIETSGLKGFEIQNAPIITATGGAGGTWLIDPYDIEIKVKNENSDNFPDGGPFGSTSSRGPELSVTSVTDVLSGGGVVVIQTGGSASDGDNSDTNLGNITLNADLIFDYGDGASATLRLLAHNNIILNKDIRPTGYTKYPSAENNIGVLNIELVANKDNLGGANGGNVTIANGVTIATNGGYFYSGKSAAEDANSLLGSDYTNKAVNFNAANALINTYGDLGGGDIFISAINNVDLGEIKFGYLFNNANVSQGINGGDNLVRIGSATINSGGNVTLHSAIDFNNTGRRQGDTGANGYTGNALDGQETFLNIEANGSIEIKGDIRDDVYGDYRDALNIFLVADKDDNDSGSINIDAHIYTAGGNFTATGASFDSSGFIINTDRANGLDDGASGAPSGDAKWSNGGAVTINARDTIRLGSITTDGSCVSPAICTGKLTLTAIDADAESNNGIQLTASVSQGDGSILTIAGETEINVGTGSVNLTKDNSFSKKINVVSASDLFLKDVDATKGLLLGATNVSGAVELSAAGYIAFKNDSNAAQDINAGSFSVLGAKSFTAGNITTAGGNVDITATDNITVNSIDTSGDAAGSIALEVGGGATKNIIINGDLNAQNTDSGQNTVQLTLADSAVAGIVTFGGSTLSSNVTVIGSGAADTLNALNADNTWSLTAAKNGTIKNTGNVNSKIITFVGFEAVAGGSGNDNFVVGATGSIALINGGVGTNTLVGRDADNIWEINGNNQGALKQSADVYINQFTNIQNLVGGLSGDIFDFSTNDAGRITGSVAGGAGTNTILGRNVATTWTVTGLNAGNVTLTEAGSYVNEFTSIQNLTGGTAADTFNFSTPDAAISGKLDGGATAENNAIIARTDAPNTWLMEGNEKGSVEVTSSSSTYINEFDHIQVFAGAGSDTMSFENFGAGTVQVTLGSTGSTGVTSFIGKDGVDAEIIKASGTNVWTITGANQGTIEETGFSDISFSKFNTLTGGTGKDTFNFSTVANSSISGVIDGGGDAEGNVIIARAGTGVKNTWSMTGNGTGRLEQTDSTPEVYVGQFTDIQIFTGAGVDTMSYASVDTGTVEVTLGAAGVTGVTDFVGSSLVDSTLIGENKNNAWIIEGTNAGSINFGTADAITFSNFKNLSGGSQQDTFTFDTAGILTGTLNGQNGIDTLIAKNTANTWSLTGVNSGNISSGGTIYLANFSNMQVLQGGSGVDTFNLANNFNGTINGGAGNDVFNINAAVTTLNGETGSDRFIFNSAANAGSAANIDGGGDTNTLVGRVDDNTWTINSQNAGTLGTSGSLYVNTFTNIQSLNGSASADTFNINAVFAGSINSGAGDNIFNINAAVGDLVGGGGNDSFVFLVDGSANSIDGAGGTNTLVGKNSATTWDINLAESGSLTDIVSGTYLNSFGDIQTLQGGSATDTFNLNAVFSGLVNGGNGADVFNINAVVNELQGGDSNDSFIFSSTPNAGVATIIGGGSGTNTLTGRNGNNTWTIAGGNSGTLGVTGELGNYVNLFSDIQTLNGGTGNDIFILNNTFSGSINAGAGTNTFNVNAAVGALTGGDGDDNFVFGAAGSATTVNGGDGNNQITARDGLNIWNLSVVNGGSLRETGGENYINTFSNIQILFGGNSSDIFNINQSFAGSLYGGLGDDSFRFTSTNNAGSVSLIDGGAGANDLMGRNEASIWTITAANTGTLGLTTGGLYVADFSNIQSLTGGSAADTFVINAAINNIIDAGSGNNIFNINAAVGSLVGGDGNDSFVFGSTGSANIIDGAGGSNTLQAKDIANTWTLTADNQGAVASAGVNYVSLFSNIQNLQGGSNTDLFNLTFRFDGAIRGGAGNDHFVVDAQAQQLFGEGDNDSFVFSSDNNQGSAALISGGAGVNSLTGRNAANTWTVSSLDAGSLAASNALTYVTSFTSIQTLNGGSDADTFLINANVSNGIFAGAGNNIFNVNTLVSSLTGGADNDRFVFEAAGSANSIDGGAGTNTLVGRNSANTWLLTAANTGSLGVTNGPTYVSDFSNIQVLQGGNAVDTFNLRFAFSGTVNGGADNDIFNVDAVVNLLQGEDGSDSFLFSNDANVGTAAIIDGGNGNNSLTGRNQNNTWTISGENTGTLALTAGANYVTEFRNVQSLNGGTGVDNFIINAAVNNAINAGAGDNTFTINADVGNISGGAGNDSFVFGESGRADSVSGGGGVNSLVGRNGLNTWEFSGADQGRIRVTNGAAYVDSFSDIQTLQGGNSIDIFNITNSYTGSIRGGASDDSFNISAGANQLYGETGNDSFVLIGQSSSVGLLDGGAGSNNIHGRNAANTWQITSANGGNLAVTNGATYVSEFSNIQNIFGGTTVDIFQINATIASVNGGNGNDEFRINAAAGNLYGNDDDDQFIFSSANNTGSATLIDGGNGQNQIFGRNTTNTWSITATNAGKLSVTAGSAYVANFNNVQTLIGGNLADIFDINANVTNSINAGDGDNIFNVNTTVGHLVGGAGNDQFAFGAQGDAQSVDGGGGNANSLTGRNAENTWTITSANAGRISSNSNEYLDSFSNIQILNGGIGDDTFNINAAAGSIFGHAGNDIFSFAANNNGVAALIDGGAGGDTLRGRTQTSTWTMTGANAGSVSAAGTSYAAAFTGIETLSGQAGSDTLAAINQENAWSITDENRGSLRATTTGAAAISFEGMENLLGNEGVDSFVFEANAAKITGLIDGGSSITKNVVKDLLDLTRLTSNLTVNLGARQNNALNVANIETITASASNVENHIIQGASDAAYRWNIDGQDKGVIEHVTNPLLETSVNFVNFGDLRGGSNSDRFDVQGSISKNIDGGDGEDLVDYSKRQENFVITLGGGGGLGITGINSIEGVVGNSSASNGFTSTIQVASGYNTWEIDGKNDGNIVINNKKITFEDFTNLIGGTGNDTFKYLENGQWIGVIDGGGGTDTIDSSLSAISQNFVIDGVNQTNETTLKNIDEIKGNTNVSSTLASRSRANTWQISSNGGRLNGDIEFTNIAHLEGGSFVDNFIISSLSSSSSIDGGSGADIANLGSINESIRVAIDSQISADFNLINIETISANNNVSNTLLGKAAANEWAINALNAGVLNKNINFAGFANITGSTDNDTVAFVNSAANLTGHIDLAGGSDTFDLTAAGRGITVQLNSSKSALPSGVLSVDNIELINGAAGQQNRLIADDFANTWTLNNIDAGQISSAEKSPVLFYEFANINGGSNDDTFNFEATGNVTGLLNGGDHLTRDLVDLSKSSIADVVIATSNALAGFTNVEKYIGNNIDSSITAANVDNTWSLSGTNRGVLNDVIEFENFGILKGGDKKDYFSINQARISGSIDSGDGDDSFRIQESSIAGAIQAGKGSDEFEFIITPGLSGAANIDGGEGANRLTVNGGDATYKVAHQIGSVEYADGNNNTYSILYSSLNNIFDDVVANSLSIFGTAAVNTFRLQTGRYSIDNNNQISYTNKANLVINGLAGDKAVIDGVVDLAGGITLNNLNVSAENSGILRAQSLELVSTGDVGSSSNRLKTVVSDLSLNGTNGGIYLEELDALNLNGFNVSSTDLVDLKVGGNLSSSNPLVYTGALNISSSRGSINLGNNNLLSGPLNLESTQDISLGNTQALMIGNLSAQNVNLSSGTSITASGVFSALGVTTLNAMADISLANAGNDFNQLTITNAGTVSLYDKNGFTTTGVSASNIDLRSAGNIIVGAACSIECANNYGIKAGSLKIQSDATVSINKNIVAVESSDIQAQGISVNDAITSKNISLNGGNGKLLLNETGALLAQGGGSIQLAAGSIDQHSSIVSDGNIKAVAAGDIVMMSRASIESQSGDVELSSNNLQLAMVKAIDGTVTTNAKGAITDSNLDEINIVADLWRADAANGIGVEGVDAIETEVGRLSVRNLGNIAGTKSSINIANVNSVVIEQLINNGNILFSNANGDVILDNTNNLEFDITKTNAIEQGGIINANTGVNGGTLTLSINGGSVRAINKANKANPDVIAESAAFVYPVPNAYTFGERNRKIVMHIPTYYFQSARTSSVLWHIKKPLTIVDSSVPLKNLLTNDQLIQLEGLNEIDPAIFTNVRNYVHDEVAILMPADQRFDEDEFAE